MASPPAPSSLFRFVLPPSLGEGEARSRARLLEDVLSRLLAKQVDVSVTDGYESLAVDLLAGRADAAWAPPFTCARVEAMGVRVLVRAVRHGSSSYRSTLVSRAETPLELEALAGKRALWVDRDSIAGYLLPKAFLKGRGLDPSKLFGSEAFAGSYKAALEGLLADDADLTAVFAPSEGEGDPLEGVAEILPGKSSALSILAVTESVPNDGVVVAMSTAPGTVRALEEALLRLSDDDDGRTLLRDIFHAERFETAPRLSYRALYRVALASA